MKSVFRFVITKILSVKAKNHLKKNRIQVIAVTGSIGKTSTKEAVYHILKKKFQIYKSSQGFNTELGISLAILHQEKSGFSSAKSWLAILKKIFTDKTPETAQKIILEMGADKPGDIKKLIRIAKPQIGIVTNVNPVHLGKGQFKDMEDIKKEKNSLIRNMGSNCVAILNFDDPLVKSMETGAHKISYGQTEGVAVRALELDPQSRFLKFKVAYNKETCDFQVPVLGNFQIYSLLPAITVALKLGMDLKECAEALTDFQLPPGRTSPIAGYNKSTIIDGSYNASPTSMARALELLAELSGDRKIAALGTMNELGEMEKEAHLKLGAQAAKCANILVAVGQDAVTMKQGAIEAGMKEQDIFTFFDSEDAGHAIKKMLQPNDLVLVKGSQNRVRMEKLVKVIMEHPEQAKVLLCRQDEAWEKI